MSIDAMNWVWELNNISCPEKMVLLALANRANEDHRAWPSLKRIQKDTSLCRSSVVKYLSSLKEKGLLLKVASTEHRVTIYELPVPEKLSTGSSKLRTTQQSEMVQTTDGGSSKLRTLNPNIESQKNSKCAHTAAREDSALCAPPSDSIIFDYKSKAKTLLEDRGLNHTPDLLSQIEFYVIQGAYKQPPLQSILVAISLIQNRRWRIPSGYNGQTTATIANNEAKYEAEKKKQYEDDAKTMRGILSKIGADNLKVLKETLG